MNSKSFIITIDTEGDNQWNTEQECSTENAKYIPRFQELCEKYGFKPTWLTNYEMATDPFYIEYMKKCLKRGTCEIGMHLHAWNNPPEYSLERITNQRDYLFEYPEHIIDEKVKFLTTLLEDTFGTKMVSHRSGRWATDEVSLKVLKKYGYKVDCSVTPLINWESSLGATGKAGSDYSQCPMYPYYIYEDILEVPMSIRNVNVFCSERIKTIRNFARECKCYITGRNEWLRPSKNPSITALKSVLDQVDSDSDYAMFMLHSSEFMPGGSPSFKNDSDIDELFSCLEELFIYAKSKGYKGCTLKEYYYKKGKI